MRAHFPTLIPSSPETKYTPLLLPSSRGETIAELHNRVAIALEGIIADVDSEVTALEAGILPEQRTSKSILICAHAAPLIAMGRALTGLMPEDSSIEDFHVFTAGLSTFRRRGTVKSRSQGSAQSTLAEGTKLIRVESIPDWEGGRGVGGGWDCVSNGDCSFLSGGAERGW
jgi:transcription factor C subunit 7